MGFPDWFLFDFAVPSLPQIAEHMGLLARILFHIAALLGLLT